jgi:aminoglycoside phosphotransferase (APT) family kinase protein
LEPYFAFTADRVPAARSFLDCLLTDTRSHPLTLVHGDFSPKNVLVHEGRLVLLDHEVIHWGDPSFDLGFGLTHLLSKANHVAAVRTEFASAAVHFWDAYSAQLGDVPWAAPLEARAVRSALGCLLARVEGRSPLEYLDDAARGRQRRASLAMMADPPPTVAALTERFIREIDARADN